MSSDDVERRTKHEAILDILYQIRLHFLHRRFFMRLRAAVSAISIICGSAAVVSAIQNTPGAVLALGIAVAVASAADLVFRWADRAACHDGWRKDMGNLLAEAPRMDLVDIDARLARHHAAVDDELESLRLIAYNDNLRSNGYENRTQAEGILTRLVRAFA